MVERKGSLSRQTKETQIELTINLDGSGVCEIATGNGMLDHLVAQLGRHGLMDILIQAKGDLETGWHHLVEDVGICLGRAFRLAVGDGVGIRRMGHALVPLDESLALVAVDISGRGYANLECDLDGQQVETLPGELVSHLLESFALEAKVNLYVKIIAGRNGHHKAEAIFKALAKALRDAVEPDARAAGQTPSTKGTISA